MARPQSDTRATAGEKTVAEMIRAGLGRLTPTEKRPALALLANYPVAGLETVTEGKQYRLIVSLAKLPEGQPRKTINDKLILRTDDATVPEITVTALAALN